MKIDRIKTATLLRKELEYWNSQPVTSKSDAEIKRLRSLLSIYEVSK